MQLNAEWMQFTSGGEPVSAYRACVARGDEPRPAVIVIQEIWGADDHICDVTARFAQAGYLALAPDLYSHGGRLPQLAAERVAAAKEFLDTVPLPVWMDPAKRSEALAELPPERGAALGETLDALPSPERPIDRYAADLRAAVASLRADPGCDGRIVSIGFCLGGGLSARLACEEPSLAGAAIFYGAPLAADAIGAIGCPVRGFYGADDARIMAGVPGLVAAMRDAGKDFEAVVYEGAPHAFFNDTRASFRPAAARDAFARTLSLFAAVAPAPTVALDA